MTAPSQLGRILVVDDEAPIREMLAERLRLAGYDCRQAANAAAALEEFQQHPADLVITDLRMPGGSGMDLLAALQQRRSGAAVVLATAESDIQVAIDAMKQGAADYLLKPFQFDFVLAAVHRALEAVPGVSGVDLDLVWLPPWTPEMITPEGRRALGWPVKG